MSDTIRDLISEQEKQKYAIKQGTVMHNRLQFVVIDGDACSGDDDLVIEIKKHKDLLPFFVKESRTEVPIAGIIKNKFYSRRIDRLVIDDENKNIKILDYKTDVSHTENREKYIVQLSEYRILLSKIYP